MNTADPMVVEQFKKLPQKLKDALFADSTTENIFAIGKENGLTVSQMADLADETGLIILGITKPEDYAKNIASRIQLEPQKINKVVQTINEKIFGPIREELKTLYSTPTPPQTATVTTPPSPAPKPVESVIAPTPQQPPATVKPIETIKKDVQIKKETLEPPQIFAKPPVYIPTPSRQTTNPMALSWDEILKKRTDEPSSHPEAKNALEKALNSAPGQNRVVIPYPAPAPTPVTPPQSSPVPKFVDEPIIKIDPQTTNASRYAAKDPYREPLD